MNEIIIHQNILDNPRHEKFAWGLANGKKQYDAYLEAGFTGNRTAASRLATNVNILGRVKEIKEIIAKNNQASLESIMEELEKTRKLSMSLGQCHAAVMASMGKAKLLGLFDK